MGVFKDKNWPGNYKDTVESIENMKTMIGEYSKKYKDKGKVELLNDFVKDIEIGKVNINCSIKPLLHPDLSNLQVKFMIELMKSNITLKRNYALLHRTVIDKIMSEMGNYSPAEITGILKLCNNLQILNTAINKNFTKNELNLDKDRKSPLVKIDTINSIMKQVEKAKDNGVDLQTYFNTVNNKLVDITYNEIQKGLIGHIIDFIRRDTIKSDAAIHRYIQNDAYNQSRNVLFTAMRICGASKEAYKGLEKLTPLQMMKMAGMYNEVTYNKYKLWRFEEKATSRGLEYLINNDETELANDMLKETEKYINGNDEFIDKHQQETLEDMEI